MSRRAGRLTALLCLAAVPLTGGCSGQTYHRSGSLRVVAPVDRSDAALPVRVAWSQPPSGGPSSYLVLVDRSPQPAGQTVSYFVSDDDACQGARLKSCLTASYLGTRGIYQTPMQELTLTAVATRDDVWASAKRQHDVVVVPLDSQGRRIGGSYSTVRFRLATGTGTT